MRKKIDNLHILFLCLLCVLFPWGKLGLILISIWGIGLTSNFKCNFRYLWDDKLRRLTVISLLSYYIIMWISVLYSSDMDNGVYLMESYASIGILPFLINTSIMTKKQWKLILLSFVLGIFIFSFSQLYVALDTFLSATKPIKFPTYVSFTETIHPSHAGIYGLFSFAIVCYFLKNIKTNRWGKVISIFLLLWFSLYVYLTMSKTAILIYLLVFALSIANWLNLSVRKSILVTVMSLFAIILVIYINLITLPPRIDQAKSEFINANTNDLLSKNYLGSTESRYLIWYSSYQTWKKAPLFGFGIGDSKEELINEYKELEQPFLSSIEYSTHSEFFSTLLATGLIGLLSLLAILSLFFYCSIKRNNYLGIVLSLILLVTFTTENYWGGFNGGIFSGLMIGLVLFFEVQEVQRRKHY